MYRNAPEAGLASLLASRGRDGDSTLVHMAPQEVRGLQALALAHGGSLSINPRTGLYEASFLKKILPTIVGAALKTFAPNVGQAVGKILPFGLSDEAASNVGTGLLVGGATGLIEGDLKKGLMAGLGAYSGATLASGLEQAALATRPQAASPSTVSTAAPPVIRPSGAGRIDVASGGAAAVPSLSSMMGGAAPPMPSPVSYTPPTQAADIVKTVTKRPGLMEGVSAMFKPEGRKAFGQALGGGFQSPFGQEISRFATMYGAMAPFAPEQQSMPGAGAAEDLVYIPGGINPQYGTGANQPYMLPGQYYKRTAQGLVPANPWQKAPGFAAGGIIPRPNGNYPLAKPTQAVGGYEMSVDPYTGEEKFADGGAVQGPINVPAYAPPTDDPNVLATRSYIEELNRRARNPVVQGGTGQGLSSFGPTVPITPGGDGSGGGGGGAAGPGVGDIIGGLATNYLVNKGIETGIGYLRDKFFPGEDQLQEVEVTGTRTPTTDGGVGGAGGMPQVGGDLSNLSSYMPTTAGLQSLGTLGGLNSTGFAGTAPVSITPDGVSGLDSLSGGMKPSGSIASQHGGMRGALDAGTATDIPTPASIKSLPKTPGTSIGMPEYDSGYNLTGYRYPDGSFESVAETLRADPTAGASTAKAIINRAMNTPLDVSGVVDPSSLVNSPYATAYDKALTSMPESTAKALGAGQEAGLGSLKSKIIPGLQTAMGLHQAYQGISKGKEGQAALGAASAASGLSQLGVGALGGPVGMLAAAAIGALGASLVNTKEFGDVALRNYWKGVDQGRGIGQSNPEELAQGFINFYRTNKNDFPGQAKYGRTGNEDFVYDMTQVINKAVKDGKVDKNIDPETMYKQVVQPWLNTMGEGPKDKDARRIQDFMMTDLIHNFMQGAPISNAQVKGDKKFKIVSEKPVYAGVPPALNRTIGGNAVPNDIAREMYAQNNVRQGDLDSWAMSNPIARMQALGQMPAPQGQVQGVPDMGAGISLPDNPFARGQQPRPKQYISTSDLQFNPETGQYAPSQTLEIPDEGPSSGYVPPNPNDPRFFNQGGAIGDEYNFGFARGGMSALPEYKAGGRLLNGPGDGMSDDIPAVIRGKGVQRAALADGEFVVPADVVSHLGNGSTNAGAKKLYAMMSRVRKARTGKTRQAPAVRMERHLPA